MVNTTIVLLIGVKKLFRDISNINIVIGLTIRS